MNHILSATAHPLTRSDCPALLGPSGCGKSTLLYLVGGFLPTETGSILVDGKPVAGPGPDRGIVLQNFALFPW
jgi:NitT/TauT family transport system ATP-binding protein